MKLKNKDKERLKEKNYIMQTQEKLKSQSAITLVSLVVTIVILIILATVSINVLLGEGGLINQAKTAKFETEKAAAREQIEVVLLEAAMDKALNSEYNENEYLDKFVEDRLKGVWLEQDEISYDGFIFALDRSVPKLGNYTGQDEGPRIKEIKVTGKTTNSVSIEVDARNAEGGKYTYSYKKDSEGEEAWIESAKEVEENTYTFDNLEENEIYNLKVRIETSEGEIEQTINEITGEVPKGTITFEEVEWVGDGTAKVRINTSAQGYTMQYIIVKQGESTEGLPEKNWSKITSGSEITGLYYADTVYARLYDGTNESDYASVTVEDKTAPEVTVSPNGAATSNSISVSVEAQDNESGMKETPTYTYYIKKTSEEEGSYQVPVGATSITSNTYTFTELTQGTSYDVKVEVNGDKAENVGTGALENQTTGTVPGGETGVEEGVITFGNTTWGSNNKASVTVDTNTSYTIEYQVGNIEEGSWTEIEKGGTIGNLNYNDTVYARLTDGTNHGDYASVTIEDKIAPVVNVTAGGTTSNSVTVSASATDGQSGMKDSLTYTYSIKETGQADTNYTTPENASNISENTYTFTGLTQGKNYTVRVQVNGDKANNVGTGILDNQTTGTVPGAEGGLQTGNITASAVTWSNGEASITLSTSTGLTIQYQVNNTTEGSWQTGTSVTGLHHGDAVFARLTDGNNYGDYASVNILDGIAPKVSISTSKTSSSITITIEATDNESGLADNNIYTYTITGGSVEGTNPVTKDEKTHTFSGLTAETPYTIKVEVKDKAGNVEIVTTTETTKKRTVSDAIDNETKFEDTTKIDDDKGNEIWIPGGFEITNDSATNINDGIVIQDSKNKNQFVWVPVPNYTTMYEIGTKKLDEVNTTTTVYSKLRLRSGESFKITTPGDTTGIREPDLSNDGDRKATNTEKIGYANKEEMAEGIVSEYTAIYNSIKKYKGFYIGRYEIGGSLTTPTLKKGQQVMSGYSWYSLKKACTDIVSNEFAQSVMIYGNQWDETLRWLISSGDKTTSEIDNSSGGWGNYGSTQERTSGFNEQWKANNIYDLAGNYEEWTQEARDWCYRTIRGGGASGSGDFFPASARSFYYPYGGAANFSSRPTMYIK